MVSKHGVSNKIPYPTGFNVKTNIKLVSSLKSFGYPKRGFHNFYTSKMVLLSIQFGYVFHARIFIHREHRSDINYRV